VVAVPAYQHWLVRLAIWLLVCSAPMPGAAQTPNQASGVFGLVPNYAEDLQRLEKQIALTKRQLEHLSTHAPRGMADSLKRYAALRDSMKNRCAEAFDPDSRRPRCTRSVPPPPAASTAAKPASTPSAFREAS